MSDLITQYLVQGDLIGFVLAIFTSSMGEYFLGFVILLVTVPVYMRTQSLAYVYLLWLLVGSTSLLALVPLGAYTVAAFFTALGGAGILYKLFVSR